jgi:hypothetical protein
MSNTAQYAKMTALYSIYAADTLIQNITQKQKSNFQHFVTFNVTLQTVKIINQPTSANANNREMLKSDQTKGLT